MSFALRAETGPNLSTTPNGLMSEPPLSPTPLGARPTVVELPVQPAPVQPAGPDPESAPDPTAADAWAVEDADAGPRRVVVRLIGSEDVELGETGSRDEALAAAREVVRRIAAAEDRGEWPEFEGRLLRPGAIVSVDVLRTER